MTVKHKCSAKVPDMYGVPNVHPCRRSATVERDGQRWCWQHDPERVKADAEKRLTAWQAEQDRLGTVCARRTCNARLAELVTPELAELLEKVGSLVGGKGWTSIGLFTSQDGGRCRELAAQIRQALETGHE